ncbi:hypothetical protein EYF80_017439 [Liparis tanakae]|uniref:Uncharacterized protein n=1 Tax=Liparis tanakae TaxID=230148 RepID=A0A4Z2I2S8_9TELE|nr:hypothetical protein EYF80_017439 [Liparis tanakae]
MFPESTSMVQVMVSVPWVLMKPSSQTTEMELPSWKLSPKRRALMGIPGSDTLIRLEVKPHLVGHTDDQLLSRGEVGVSCPTCRRQPADSDTVVALTFATMSFAVSESCPQRRAQVQSGMEQYLLKHTGALNPYLVKINCLTLHPSREPEPNWGRTGAWEGRPKGLLEQAAYRSRPADQWTQRMIDDIIKLAHNIFDGPCSDRSVVTPGGEDFGHSLAADGFTALKNVVFSAILSNTCTHQKQRYNVEHKNAEQMF